MLSPYKTLYDNYVPQRMFPWRFATIGLTLGCLSVLGALVFLGLRESSPRDHVCQTHVKGVGKLQHEHFTSEQPRFVLVESIPLYMNYSANSTFGTDMYQTWRDLLSAANESVDVASFYWTLTGEDIGVNSSTDHLGREILRHFQELPERNVKVRVAASIPTLARNSSDLDTLKSKGVQVRMVDFGRLTHGILHTKLWVVDKKHVYIGSANMDWRSLTQVKELGVVVYDFPRLAEDMDKIFQSYWALGQENSSIPDPWPSEFNTEINKEHPLLVNVSGAASKIYASASPPSFCPLGRTKDLEAVLSVIGGAERFINVAVMDYFPTSRFTHPLSYWPLIDDSLKQAAFDRHVPIRLLLSCGKDTDPSMLPFLQSLAAWHYPSENISIEVKVFIVPVGNQSDIPYSRVNHNKYMVTDKVAYIGTSNWSADYYITTAGAGLVISQEESAHGSANHTLRDQLQEVFNRDWNSVYAVLLSDLGHNHDCAFTR